MADLLKINQDAMKVVQLSELALGKANEWKLDTITYEIRDKEGAVVAEYEGRDLHGDAQADADNRNSAEEKGQPFYVTQRSNLSVNQQGNLDFKVGSAIGILFPYEAIDAAAEHIRNAVNCETIEELIKDEIQSVKELLESKIKRVADLTPYGALLDLPSDPLDILDWARKFVSLYLGPQVLAAVDLAIQIALTAKAIQDIIIAVSAAQQNLLLCAVSVVDTTLEESIDAATDLLDTAVPGLDTVLTEINDIQNQISGITGKPPVFDVANGIDGLMASATTEAKAEFMTQVNEYATAVYDPVQREADLNSAADSMNTALGLPPRGSAVPGNVEVVIDGATFTFMNGILVQATGTNSATGGGGGISTNSQTSTPTMSGFVSTEWDGTVPDHVELITGLEAYGDVLSLPTGEIGPFTTPSFLTLGTQKWYIPNNLKVSSAKFSLRNDRVGFGRGNISFVDGAGFSDLWRSGLGTIDVGLVMWMSATPGGSPLTDAYGTPVVTGGAGSNQQIKFTQGYDLSLITDDGVAQVINAKGAGQFAITGDKPHYTISSDASGAVLLPVATKTFFFNMALVSATDMTTFITNGTVPGSSDLVQWIPDPAKTGDDYQYYLSQVPNQFRVASGGKLGDTDVSLTQFLAKTFIRTDSANTIYNGTDTTMETFIGSTWGGTYPSSTQLITGWQYTNGNSVTGSNTNIGFVSDTPITNTARKYPIPLNGKISTSDFSVGWGGSDISIDSDFDYNYYFDRNSSTFDLTWSAPDDNLSRAWYDLDLMPVAWMSDTPGGSPKTLVDGSTGKVIKLEQTGATYKAQQLLSTTKSLGADRATLPIVQKTFFLNVAVVSANTATSLVASGTAPVANQCISWSVSDPALGYTGSGDQHLKFELGSRTTDRSDKAIAKT